MTNPNPSGEERKTMGGGVRMGEKPIGKGDMVMLVRWPHRCSMHPTEKPLGAPFTVREILPDTQCFECGEYFGISAVIDEFDGDYKLAYPVAWLKRIDPPAIPTETPEALELGA